MSRSGEWSATEIPPVRLEDAEAMCLLYGWPADLNEDEVLARLLALNMERTAAGGGMENGEGGAEDEDEGE